MTSASISIAAKSWPGRPAGSGSTGLLAALFGVHPVQGEILLGNRSIAIHGPRSAIKRRIAHVPEDRKTDGLIVQLPAGENLHPASIGLTAPASLIGSGNGDLWMG